MTIEEKVFPELAESEDEKIRKMIINHLNQERGSLSNEEAAEALTWLEKQGVYLENHDDEDILQRFSFYSYKDEPNIIYLSGLYVNAEHQNKGIGTKILSIADEVAVRMGCNVIRLKTEIGSNAERLYRRNGYNTFQIEGNQVWLEKQKEPELSEDLGDYIAELSKQFPEVSFAKLSRIAVRVKNWLEEQGEANTQYWRGYREGKQNVLDKYTELEKQGEHTDKVEPKFEIGDEIKTDNEVPLIITKIDEQGYWSGDLFICSFEDSAKWELVGKIIDKVEPKFKVGDFIVNDYCAGKVIALTDDAYLLDTGQGIPFSYEYNARLWTIEDAKDGDVLATDKSVFIYAKTLYNKPYAYCGVDKYGVFKDNCLKNNWANSVNNIHPATKEQRELLFQKMKEAGYEWNAEKKELKKISQRMISAEAKEALYDKPTDEEMKELLRTEYEKGRADVISEMKSSWSEEDEKTLNEIFSVAARASLRKSTLFGKSYDYIKWQNWLKSLRPQNNITDEELAQAKKDAYNDALDKIEYHSGEPTFDDGWSAAIWYLKKKNAMPQNTWKPSNEQMEAFEHFVRSVGESGYASPYDNNTKLLYSLLEQLKKLSEK